MNRVGDSNESTNKGYCYDVYMYSKKIDRNHPAAIMLLLDQSLSMKLPWDNLNDVDDTAELLNLLAEDFEQVAPDDHRTRSNRLAELTNAFIRELILSSTFDDEVRPYFHLAVIGYGGEDDVTSLLDGTSIEEPFIPINKLHEPTVQETTDSSGRLRRRLQWIEPKSGGSTPMFGALGFAREALMGWVLEHSESFPPIVFNITDGEPTDLDIEDSDDYSEFVLMSNEIRSLSTADGCALLFSALISNVDMAPQMYPSIKPQDDLAAALLFETSSILPENLRVNAESIGLRIGKGGKCFIFKADSESLIGMLNIGTLATQFL